MGILYEDLSGIPDDHNFVLDGKSLKDILKILQIANAKDRNTLFSIWLIDTTELYVRIKALKEVQLEVRHIDKDGNQTVAAGGFA